MVKKFLKTFLATGIFSILFLWGSFSLAVTAPQNLIPPNGVVFTKDMVGGEAFGLVALDYEYIAINFSWDKVLDPSVGWYHLIYRCKENCSGGSAMWVIQPTSDDRPFKPVVGLGVEDKGYSLPTAVKKFEWQVGACSSQAEGACVYSQPQEFITPLQPPPPTSPPSPPPSNGNEENGGGFLNPLKCQDLFCAINALINFLFVLAMALGPLLIIYAAFLILTAAGNAEQINKAKTIIIWTLVALAIVLLAKGLPAVIQGAVGG